MTPPAQRPFPLSDEEERLCYQFMREFSRFEFALKRSGYVSQRKKQLIVEWQRFVQENSIDYDEVPDEVQYIVAHPPKRQVIASGSLGWEAIASPSGTLTLSWLLTAAYAVRNNLFHGGKFADRLDVSRDTSLIRAAREVIGMAIMANPNVSRHYEEQ